jgi:hypothetical protein
MSFNFSLFFIFEELRQMSSYLDVVVSGLEVNAQNLDLEFEETMKQETSDEFSEEYEDWLISKHQDNLMEAQYDFPQLLLVSFVILWYSFVEQKLIDFCEELELVIVVSPKDDRNLGKGIRRAQKFLSQVKKYDIDQKHWQELVCIGKLRNLLVHEGRKIHLSYIKPNGESVLHKRENQSDIYIPIEESLYKYMKKNNLFNVSGVFLDIVPSVDYCKELVRLGGEIFRKLYADLKSIEE